MRVAVHVLYLCSPAHVLHLGVPFVQAFEVWLYCKHLKH